MHALIPCITLEMWRKRQTEGTVSNKSFEVVISGDLKILLPSKARYYVLVSREDFIYFSFIYCSQVKTWVGGWVALGISDGPGKGQSTNQSLNCAASCLCLGFGSLHVLSSPALLVLLLDSSHWHPVVVAEMKRCSCLQVF